MSLHALILAADSAGRREALKDLIKGAGLEPRVAADWPAALAAIEAKAAAAA